MNATCESCGWRGEMIFVFSGHTPPMPVIRCQHCQHETPIQEVWRWQDVHDTKKCDIYECLICTALGLRGWHIENRGWFHMREHLEQTG